MPSRSLQRLPPRSPPRSPGRSARCRARPLAGRAGTRHRHPLPEIQDNKAEHPAETRTVCPLPEDNRTQNQSGCLVPRTTLRGAGGGSDAVRRQVIQIAAGFARTRRRPLSFPGFPG
jgi:hypothetical protein